MFLVQMSIVTRVFGIVPGCLKDGWVNYINCIKLLIIIKATFLNSLKEKYEKFIVNIEVTILNAE